MAPPSSNVITIDWNVIIEPHHPYYVPFKIVVECCGRHITNTITDERDFVSILSSNAWKVLGSPHLAWVTQNLLDFNIRVSQPLGILPQFPITLAGKMVCIVVMVVHDHLDFNFFLERDYVYTMQYFLSKIFRVMCFPHNGIIVTID
jgi:hypothetical protein